MVLCGREKGRYKLLASDNQLLSQILVMSLPGTTFWLADLERVFWTPGDMTTPFNDFSRSGKELTFNQEYTIHQALDLIPRTL